MRKGRRRYLKVLGYAEGASFLVLLAVGMPLKYATGQPEFSKITGTVHGCLFLMYVTTLLSTGRSIGLTRKQILWGVFLSCWPFGLFLFEMKVAPWRPRPR